jgi:hypothetical protein
MRAGRNTDVSIMVRAQWHASVSARTYTREYVCGASIIGAHFAHLPGARGVHRSVKFIRLVLIKQSAVLMKSTHRQRAPPPRWELERRSQNGAEREGTAGA